MNMYAARSKRRSYYHEPYLVLANSLLHSLYIESLLLLFPASVSWRFSKRQTLQNVALTVVLALGDLTRGRA
jgi:hypothetical protein